MIAINKDQTTISEYLIICAISCLLFIPFIGAAHLFDWDEANFGEAAREMVISNNWLNPQIDYQLFWEKPPIFIWMQAICMKIFGINEFAARFPNVLISIVTLCSLFFIGNKVVNKRMAWIWVFMYVGSWLTHFYFKSAIIDPTFNLFIFLSIYFLYKSIDTKSGKFSIWSGLMIGLGVLTKGPVAALIVGLCGLIFIIRNKNFKILTLGQYALTIITTLVTIFLWLGVDIINNGLWFTETFLTYQYRLFSTQDAGHGGPWYYHPLVITIGCFPSSIFLWHAITRKSFWVREHTSTFHILMTILFFTHLILFSIVKTKIIHYSSLCYFPLTFWAAVEVDKIFNGNIKFNKFWKITGICIGTIIGFAITVLPIVGIHKDKLAQYIKDPFTQANLTASVDFSYTEVIFGVLIIISSIWIILCVWKLKPAKMYLFLGIQAIMISAIISHFTPKIEAFSQGGAIAFYKQAHEENKLVYPIMMKSYAYLFYSNKQPLLNEHMAKNVYDALNPHQPYKDSFYFVSKIIHKEKILKENPALFVKDEKAGYVLYAFSKDE